MPRSRVSKRASLGATTAVVAALGTATLLVSGFPSALAQSAEDRADTARPASYDSDPISILGPSRVDAAGLVEFAQARGHTARLTVPIEELAQLFLEEGARYGVRADIAWVQSLVETGWFTYPDYGQVHWQDNNFAGIGAFDGGAPGWEYNGARRGVVAQMQLLRGYADPEPLPDAFINPPSSYRGIAPTWAEMGNGHWATAPHYASTIIGLYTEMLDELRVEWDGPPVLVTVPDGSPAVPTGPPPPPPEPVGGLGDALWIATADGQVYDVGAARFWGSAVGRRSQFQPAAMMAFPGGESYVLVGRDGRLRPFGVTPGWVTEAARIRRSDPERPPIVAAAMTRKGYGAWLVDALGGIQALGSARPLRLVAGTLAPGETIVAAAATRIAGEPGLWLTTAQGRVIVLGSATDFGSMTLPSAGPDSDVARNLEAAADDPVTSIAVTPWDDGYWLVTARGRVVPFGKAQDHGSLSRELREDRARERGRPLRTIPRWSTSDTLIRAIRVTPTGMGYWLVTADGRVYGRGDAADYGDIVLGETPVVAVTNGLDLAPRRRTVDGNVAIEPASPNEI